MGPIAVTITEPRTGWGIIRVPLSEFRKNVELERLPGLLDKTLTGWLLEHPRANIRAAMPIVEDGFTTSLHFWWD
jgi:hypothetical protein